MRTQGRRQGRAGGASAPRLRPPTRKAEIALWESLSEKTAPKLKKGITMTKTPTKRRRKGAFPKGRSGNPDVRPRGTSNHDTELRRVEEPKRHSPHYIEQPERR